MSSFALKPTVKFFGGAMIALSLLLSACQPQPATNSTNTNTTNTTTTNINSSNTSNANAGTTSTSSGLMIETKEPDQYSATVTMKVEATGNQTMSLPALSLDFARSGANQRLAFKLGNDSFTYLDRGDKRYVILPNRKQYAELDAQSTGFDLQKLMTPSQIISQVKRVSGCENAGDESFGGRSAVKYRCAAAAKTGTQAGNVSAESFIYVDKETGLPLHTESFISSSGNVGGENSIKFITEMSNIQTTVPADTFNEPTGMSKIDPQQVRSQVETILKAAASIMQAVIQNNSSSSAPAASPSASQTPSQ